MTILEALKSDDLDLRIDNGNHWLIINESGEFVVYERKYHQRKTRIISTTFDEEMVVRKLTEEG